MFRKLALGLVAAASLGAMALAPSAASANGWHHHHHFGHFGHGFGIAYVGGDYDDGCYAIRRVLTPFGYRLRTINVCD